MTEEDKKAINDFREAVNMSPKIIEEWLQTAESKKVGYKDDGEGESVGHQSGKKIVAILEKKRSEYSDADIKHIHKLVGYIHRHLAQRPDGDISETPWRYSLMNWGHDPK